MSERPRHAAQRALAGAVLALAAAAAASPRAARADVAVLTQASVAQYAEVVAALLAATAARVVDAEDAAGVERLLANPPEVLVAVGGRAFDLARARATRSAVVAAAVLNPDARGRADVTAVPLEPRPAEVAAALSALAPKARRAVAVHGPGGAAAAAAAVEAGRKRGLEVDVREFTDEASFRWAFLGWLQDHDAVWLLPDPRLAKPELVHFMARACTERRVALVGFLDGMARAGALAAVAADLGAIGREAARVAADLDARPRERRTGVPFRLAAGRVVVNDRVRAATALGGALPAGAEVIR